MYIYILPGYFDFVISIEILALNYEQRTLAIGTGIKRLTVTAVAVVSHGMAEKRQKILGLITYLKWIILILS